MRARRWVLVAVGAWAAWVLGACATGLFGGDAGIDASCGTCGDGGTGGDGGDGGTGGDGGQGDGGGKQDGGGCGAGQTSCAEDGGNAVCVDTKSDPNHCGSCASSCLPTLQACEAGTCTSLCGAKTLCIPDGGAGDAAAPHCADLQKDTNDCGGCGVRCDQDASCSAGVCVCGPGSQAFAFTGSQQTFVVPCGITSVNITALGAAGANAQDRLPSGHSGGLGGKATGTLAVTPGETLYVNVGGQGTATGAGGWNGGGAGGSSTAGSGCSGGPAGGGGGMSDVRQGGSAWSNIVIAAAGGGGSGRDYCNGSCQPCGCGGGSGGGGGSTGVAGGAAHNCGYGYAGSNVNGGPGGTQSAGGAGGSSDGSGNAGKPGGQGTGGGGAAGSYDVAGGGGGGGYYGGGGGGGAASGSGVGGGGGGGGSSYTGKVTSGTTTQAVQSGDGSVTITW